MQQLHDRLMEKGGAYAKWHNHPKVHTFQWLILLLVVASVGWLLVSRASQTEQYTYGQVIRAKQEAPAVSTGAALEPAQDHILVKFKNSVGQSKRAEVLAKHGLAELSEIKQIGVKIVSIPDSDTPDEAIQSLKSQEADNIEYAEPDLNFHQQAIPNDPSFPNQWQLQKISAPAGWDISTGTPAVIIADIDSGADWNNTDLAARLVPGWSFLTGTSNTQDTNGHGTAVALIMAAVTNNGLNTAGVSWNNPVMPLVVLDSTNSGSGSNINSAIIYAADHGVKVINMSLAAANAYMQSMQDAVNYAWGKGVVSVAASGNSGNNTVMYPAALANVIGVSATDNNDVLQSFSSWGSQVDLSAPASGGTSFSSPVGAAEAALVFSRNPSLSPSQVVSLMEQNADDLGTLGYDQMYGYGRVNMFRTLSAVSAIQNDVTPPSASTNLTASAISSFQVNLAWTASTDNIGVAGYNVYRNGAKIAAVPLPSFVDTTVTDGTSYNYTVAAYDVAGNVSGMSNTATVTTPLVFKISSFSVSGKTTTTATITWTTSFPSTGTISYGLKRTVLNLSASDGALSTTHSVTLTGLSQFTSYYYKISAVNSNSTATTQTAVSSFKTARK